MLKIENNLLICTFLKTKLYIKEVNDRKLEFFTSSLANKLCDILEMLV